MMIQTAGISKDDLLSRRPPRSDSFSITCSGGRSLLAAVIVAASIIGASAQTYTTVQNFRNTDAYVYALNYEYLLASFYTCAATGQGIPASLTGGGPAVDNCRRAQVSDPYKAVAAEFAHEEQNHVAFIRAFLGDGAPAMPQISLDFTDWVNLAWGSPLAGNGFQYWLRDHLFLIAAFILEDVAVTAYQGEMGQFSDYPSVMGMMSVQGYHAGAIRQMLIGKAYEQVYGQSMQVYQLTAAISNLRATLSQRRNPTNVLVNDDQNIISEIDGVTTILVPSNGYTFSRTTQQVQAVFTGTIPPARPRGYFFPQGFAYFPGSTNAANDIAAVQTELSPLSEAEIFGFALNLEFLEAIFYSYAVQGRGIGHMGANPGMVYGARKANLSPPVLKLATEIYNHEYDHVAFFVAKLQSLGAPAISSPELNYTAFASVVNAAFGTALPEDFDPFLDDYSFLIAAYIFEDVGVSAYINAIAHLSDSGYLGSGSGIAALESYHAGAIRMLMFMNATQVIDPIDANYATIATVISELRAAASHANDDVPFISASGAAQISNCDPADSFAYNRSPAQIVSIATLGSETGAGGFFPSGLNGPVNGTRNSVGSYQNLPTARPPTGSTNTPSPSPSPTPSPTRAPSPTPTPQKMCPCACPAPPSGRRLSSRRRLLLDM